ncbi:NlpC/P60 family protein [Robiginitalea myxolifaciens]|uniref:NlpC/P60 family protein n=1 Tax=Robiginitalea myxolifaciens TaxID=400055 RepID=A0A1I6H3D1_9FLAO|nr:NlpC/P60 family protein [Robiginitalea myxolifaciens]SFR48877.1 NlpC/P60 family protein [Robiginitalea myxolifaciens]
MRYGICPLSLVPVFEEREQGKMLTQLLYGELFKILDSRKNHYRIRVQLDKTEGWIRKDQAAELEEAVWEETLKSSMGACTQDLFSHIINEEGILFPVAIGANAVRASLMDHRFEGDSSIPAKDREHLISQALLLLNSPEMPGGRSPLGIDAGGFTQLVYKCCGYALDRNPQQQALQGDALSFIEESEPGDLAFFDGPDGAIDHVGIIMKNNYIIHVHGQVRIDRIDHSGIFNTQLRRYTHPLRVIKKLL